MADKPTNNTGLTYKGCTARNDFRLQKYLFH